MHLNEDWQKVLMLKDNTIQQAICNLNETALQVIIVTSEKGFFLGIITDGDIRRGLLRGLTLSATIDNILNPDALVVPPSMSREAVLHMMEVNRLQQVPVLDKTRRVIGLHLWNNKVVGEKKRPNIMILMAGGFGTRLRPHTETCPKAMLPVDGKPILEHIIERAKGDGFRHFVLAIRYLGDMIENYFGNGELWGIKIEYIREDEPLGTAGALSLFEDTLGLPLLVSNCDVLTDIRYGELLDFHVQQKAVATMAVRLYELQHPFGVVKIKDLEVVGFEEKPMYRSNVNTGIYVLDASVLKVLVYGEHCDMPTLFTRLIEKSKQVIAYPIHEKWLDIGRIDDYKSATSVVRSMNASATDKTDKEVHI